MFPILIDLTTKVSRMSRQGRLQQPYRLNDGETLVLGGLIKNQESVNYKKVPVLGSLPLIGGLFRLVVKPRFNRTWWCLSRLMSSEIMKRMSMWKKRLKPMIFMT